jgi:hypothetical protein
VPSLHGLALLAQLYGPACGLLWLAAGLLPISFLARALVGSLLALGGLALIMTGPAAQDWRYIAAVAVCFLLPAALFHRWRYRGSLFARALVAACVLTVFAVLLLPRAGAVPLLAIFNDLGGGVAVVAKLWPLALLLLSLLSLLAFLGSGSTGFVAIWAVCLLLYLPLQTWIGALLGLGSGSPWASVQLLYSGAALLAYLSLTAQGLSQIMAAVSRSTQP